MTSLFTSDKRLFTQRLSEEEGKKKKKKKGKQYFIRLHFRSEMYGHSTIKKNSNVITMFCRNTTFDVNRYHTITIVVIISFVLSI